MYPALSPFSQTVFLQKALDSQKILLEDQPSVFPLGNDPLLWGSLLAPVSGGNGLSISDQAFLFTDPFSSLTSSLGNPIRQPKEAK